ncbi:hypothetical protein D6T64_05980 [Cryobacterium melibiosiphilum]|uniref:Uncharacterized protein n=1 Tax=Cryobacterium melibiosiphilum TaxID=995039 RepID=A0A3A5MKR1_9MICO|nr:hypothetical protein [Cryobacterium melibiosiphilum]RJT89635.1 hypothetical protein D6T64_05980 [Cryobacterium melibiosiphilum]
MIDIRAGRSIAKVALVGVLGLVLTAGALPPADDAAATDDTLPASFVMVPGQQKTVHTDASAGALGIEIPGTRSVEAVPVENIPSGYFTGQGAALLSTELPGAQVSTFRTFSGSQSVIQINEPDATTEFRFPLDLPRDASASIAADGSVTISDPANHTLGAFDIPWAFDADGEAVPTFFEIDGEDLVQTVAHSPEMSFPIVADPTTAWGWTVCVASVGALVAGNMLVATKITKLGGVAKVIIKLKAAKNADTRWSALLTFFGEFTGIGAVLTNCR